MVQDNTLNGNYKHHWVIVLGQSANQVLSSQGILHLEGSYIDGIDSGSPQ